MRRWPPGCGPCGTYRDAGGYYRADPDALYVSRHVIDLDVMEPQVAKPFSPDNVHPVSAVAGMHLDGAFIGACTTTEEELVLGALVLEQVLAAGHQPVASANRLVVPGDRSIVEKLQSAGLLAVYERAGFRIGPPGCSMCLGIASEKAASGEVWITSQNRNYQNRMGAGSLAWLASASVVAASSVGLAVADPRPWLQRIDRDRYHASCSSAKPGRPLHAGRRRSEPTPSPRRRPPGRAPDGAASAAPIVPVITGRIQRFGDHVDTDAIIPGEFCHLTDLGELGQHAFHYVAPGFAQRVDHGAAVLVAGEGWGSGSSREHAVWALKGAGVQAVIARSFAYIHQRNLTQRGHALSGAEGRCASTRWPWKVLSSLWISPRVRVTVGDETFRAEVTTPIAQGLASAGGIVPAIQTHGNDVFEHLTH